MANNKIVRKDPLIFPANLCVWSVKPSSPGAPIFGVIYILIRLLNIPELLEKPQANAGNTNMTRSADVSVYVTPTATSSQKKYWSEQVVLWKTDLRGIPNDINPDLHLSKIHKEWNNFYHNHPNATKKELLDKVTEINQKYGSSYNPPKG